LREIGYFNLTDTHIM